MIISVAIAHREKGIMENNKVIRTKIQEASAMLLLSLSRLTILSAVGGDRPAEGGMLQPKRMHSTWRKL